MNKIIIQLWEESTVNQNPISDGCSIHISIDHRNEYVDQIYNERKGKKVPQTYERIVGGVIEAFIEDNLYNRLINEKNMRLSQIELNNLVYFEELTIKED